MKLSSKHVETLACLVAVGAFGRAAAPSYDSTSAGQAATSERRAPSGQHAASPHPALITDKYKLVNDSIKGTLVIDAVEPASLAHLTAVRRNQGGGLGDVSTSASIVDGVAKLQHSDDCTVAALADLEDGTHLGLA